MLVQSENGGVIQARNRALSESSGRFVAFLTLTIYGIRVFFSTASVSKRHAQDYHHSYLRFRCNDALKVLALLPSVIDSSNVLRKNFSCFVLVDREVVGDFSFPAFRPDIMLSGAILS